MATKQPKIKELRAMTDADMQAQLDTLHQELWQSSLKAREGTLQQPHVLGQIKRQIARLHTLRGQIKKEENKVQS